MDMQLAFGGIDRLDHGRIGASEAVAQHVYVRDADSARQMRDDLLHHRVHVTTILAQVTRHAGTRSRDDEAGKRR